LNEFPTSTIDRLAAVRQEALARKKPDSPAPVTVFRFATTRNVPYFGEAPLPWLPRMSLLLSALALAIGLLTIFQHERQQYFDETAELDEAMLVDELPLVAYADQGFDAYLSK
jgi:hypothetical protein